MKLIVPIKHHTHHHKTYTVIYFKAYTHYMLLVEDHGVYHLISLASREEDALLEAGLLVRKDTLKSSTETSFLPSMACCCLLPSVVHQLHAST